MCVWRGSVFGGLGEGQQAEVVAAGAALDEAAHHPRLRRGERQAAFTDNTQPISCIHASRADKADRDRVST